MDSTINELRVRQGELNERLATLCGRDVVTKVDVEAATSKCINTSLMRESILRSDLEALALQHEAVLLRSERAKVHIEELTAVKKQLAEMEAAHRSLQKDYALSVERLQASESQVVMLSTSLTEVQTTSTELQRQNRFLEKTLMTVETEKREWKTRAAYESSAAQVLQSDVEGGRESTEYYMSEIKRLDARASDAERKLEAAEMALAATQDECDALAKRLRQVDIDARSERERREAEIEADISVKTSRITELEQICETEHASNVTLADRSARLLASLTEEREQRAAEQAAYELRVGELDGRVMELELLVKSLTGREEALTAANNALNVEVDNLKVAARAERMTLQEDRQREVEALVEERDAKEQRARSEMEVLRDELARASAEVSRLAAELAEKEIALGSVDLKSKARHIAQLEAERDSLRHELQLNLESRRQLTESHGRHLTEAAEEINALREQSEAKTSRFEDFEATIKALRCQLTQEQVVVEKLSDRLVVAGEVEKECAALRLRLEESETRCASLVTSLTEQEQVQIATRELTLSRDLIHAETMATMSNILAGIKEVERSCTGIDESLTNHSVFVRTLYSIAGDLDTIHTMLGSGKAPTSVLSAARTRCRHALNHHLTETERRYLGAAPGRSGIEFAPSAKAGAILASAASAKQLKQHLVKLSRACETMEDRVSTAAKATSTSTSMTTVTKRRVTKKSTLTSTSSAAVGSSLMAY